MIKVLNEVEVHEIDGKDQLGYPRPKLRVDSHPSWDHFVIIQWPGDEGHTVSVGARDLEAAITNARNSNRHG